MKLVSFVKDGKAGYGLVKDGGIVDLGKRFGKWPTLKAALAAGGLAELGGAAKEAADFPLGSAELLPPIPDPDKIICIGLNYRLHIAEGTQQETPEPALFTRFPDTLVGHGQAMVRPRVSEKFDYEGELAFVVGRTARHVPAEKALDYIAGYACFVDGSVRDYQRHTSQFTAGKNFWKSGSFGPWLATSDEVGDPETLTLRTRLNGQEMQLGSTSDFVHGIGKLMAYITAIVPLNPGDVVATGTPHGVGYARKPPVWMKAGDTLEVEISNVGVLTNPIVDEG